VGRLAHVGAHPSDSEEIRLRKATLTLSSTLMASMAVVWVVTYWSLGLWRSGLIPFVYQLASVTSLVVFARTKRYQLFCVSQLSMSLVLPFLLQASLGGFGASSAVALWAFTAPLGALLFVGVRRAVPWFGAFVVLLVISGVVESRLAENAAAIPAPIVATFFVLNVLGVSTTCYLLLQYFLRERERILAALDEEHRRLEAEQTRSEQLLLNVLPGPIADRLKESPLLIADSYAEATVLFADLVEFTQLSERMTAHEVVHLLNQVFSRFDDLADRHGLEKIKTIGDAYMVAAGAPVPRPDHAHAVAEMALDMCTEISRCAEETGIALTIRVGFDSGPVTAGVIGRRKFIYDLWGDIVNTASRMESHGLPGCIQVTSRAYERLRDQYDFQRREGVEIKGKGSMTTYLLTGRSGVQPGLKSRWEGPPSPHSEDGIAQKPCDQPAGLAARALPFEDVG
jgi:guanylate cyclase